MNGHFEPIEKWIDSLKPEDQIFATFYLLDKIKQFVPADRIPRIFQCVRDGVKFYQIGRKYPEIGWSRKRSAPRPEARVRKYRLPGK